MYSKALFLTLLFFVSNLPLHAQLLDYIVAIVNEEAITHSQLQRELQQVTLTLQQQKIQLPAPKILQEQVLDNLILTTLQLQLARQLNIGVEDELLNENLHQVAAQNNRDLAQFRRMLQDSGYDYQRYREDLRNQLIIQRLQQRQVVNRITVSPQEIENFLTVQKQRAEAVQNYHLLHILIATPEAAAPEQIAERQAKAQQVLAQLKQGADFRSTAIAVSDSSKALEGGDLGWLTTGEIPSLFEKIVEKMTVGQISEPIRDSSGFHLLKLQDKRSAEKSLATQTKVRHILIKTNEMVADLEAQTRLDELRKNLELGEDFAKLARTHSEDAGSSQKGGLLDWISPGDLVPEFEAVMNELAERQISQPFKSRYGWHLIQVLERRQYEDTGQWLRNQAAKQIQQRKIEEELNNWLRQLRGEAYIEYKS